MVPFICFSCFVVSPLFISLSFLLFKVGLLDLNGFGMTGWTCRVLVDVVLWKCLFLWSFFSSIWFHGRPTKKDQLKLLMVKTSTLTLAGILCWGTCLVVWYVSDDFKDLLNRISFLVLQGVGCEFVTIIWRISWCLVRKGIHDLFFHTLGFSLFGT